MNCLYKLGPLDISVSGSEKMIAILGDEFHKSDISSSIDLDISIYNFFEKSYQPTHFSGKGCMDFNAEVFFVDYDHFYSYEVKNAFGKGPMAVNIYIKKPSLAREIFRFIKSVLSVEYVSRVSYIKGLVASYSLLWSIVALCLLRHRCTFIHAAILARNNHSIVLSGTGGCGKTSTALHFLSESKFQYLAEDFGVIGFDGLAHPCIKTVSLYYSDVVHGNLAAINAVKSLPFGKRVRWEFLTRVVGVNPIMKVVPVSLSKLGIPNESVPIKYGVHLSRQNVNEFTLKTISLQEYAYRSSNASGRELKPISEILKLISANAPKQYNYWDDGKLMHELNNSYLSAFKKAQVFELSIPYRATPKEVSEFLLDNLDI